MNKLIIAIDGPSGAGKGTVARAVAAELGYRHVDSGAMYRALGWKALRDELPLDDEETLSQVARRSRIDVTTTRVAIDDIDVTRAIRTPRIDRAAAAVARLPKVRAVLVERQREMGAGGGVVMEGRDIGTVVFPTAELKIFLDAAPETRAERRWKEHREKGDKLTLAEVFDEVIERDKRDRERKVSPLVRATDAVLVDNTAMGIEETARLIVMLVRERERELAKAGRLE